jgi:hypothetical protein
MITIRLESITERISKWTKLVAMVIRATPELGVNDGTNPNWGNFRNVKFQTITIFFPWEY